MPYKFNFDLSKISSSFFKDVIKFSHDKNMHRNLGKKARQLVDKFKIDKLVGIPVSDAMLLVEDFIDTCALNVSMKDEFRKTSRRALLLPHCSRKYMDNRCKARFDPKLSSYFCASCSRDCLVNRATKVAKKKGYDVYVLPGSSCVRKLFGKNYDGIVGVACTEEISLAKRLVRLTKVKVQAVPLMKNGCAHTSFRMDTLDRTL